MRKRRNLGGVRRPKWQCHLGDKAGIGSGKDRSANASVPRHCVVVHEPLVGAVE
jgi:hypothetical protein